MEKKPVDILAGSDEDSDGGEEDLSKIQINEEYARRFEHNKRREALQRLEERRKQGLVPASDDDESESESSEEEDEEAAIASRLVDRRVFEVIRRIRSGDPRILDKDAKVYSESEEEEEGGVAVGAAEPCGRNARPRYCSAPLWRSPRSSCCRPSWGAAFVGSVRRVRRSAHCGISRASLQSSAVILKSLSSYGLHG